MFANRTLTLKALATISLLVLAALPAPSKAAGFQSEWEKLRKAAQKEGELKAFICCGVGREISPFLPKLEKKLGIKLVVSTGSSRQNADRILAERRAGRYTLDVWHGGLATSNTRLIPQGVLRDIRPLLFHPEVLDKKAWYFGEGPLILDPERKYVIGFRLSPSDQIAYNTKLLDPKEIQSIRDLLDPKWKGKIVMRDPRLAGAGQSTAFYYFHPDLGPKFLRKLLTVNEPVIAPDARTAAKWLALGKYTICIFACGREVRRARRQGLPVNENFPHVLKEGARLGVGGDAIFAPTNPPHPNAQKLWINWWLSKEGQYFYQGVGGTVDSARVDIPKDNVNPWDRRDPTKKYIFFENDPEFQKKLGESMKFSRKVLREERGL